MVKTQLKLAAAASAAADENSITLKLLMTLRTLSVVAVVPGYLDLYTVAVRCSETGYFEMAV